MSMDVLKNKIRKLRNPSALTIAPTLDTLPPQYMMEYEYLLIEVRVRTQNEKP